MFRFEPFSGSLFGTSIPSSADVAGIELRMLPPLIHNNHTPRIWPFPGLAKLYCLTLVVSDAANQLRGNIGLDAFARVDDGDELPINKTIFYWEDEDDDAAKAPAQIHTLCSVIKSKESLRDVAEVLQSAKSDGEYQELLGRLGQLAGDGSSVMAVSDLTLQIAGVVGRYLGHVDDRPLATVVQSFTCLHGDWDRLGITPIHIPAGAVDFNYELVVRDRSRGGLQTAGAGAALSCPAPRCPVRLSLQPL
jgi:hypothetical protein